MKNIKVLLFFGWLLVGSASAEPTCQTATECFNQTDKAIIAQDFKRAVRYADVGCTKGSADSCGAMGVFYQRGLGVKKDLAKSYEYLEKSCRLGSGDGCAVLASTYLNGKQGAPKKPEKAVEMATIGCEYNNALSCMVLATAETQGLGISKDINKANRHFDKACQIDKEIVCPRVQQVRKALLQAQ